MTDRAKYLRGILQTGLGVLILTPDALILRLVEADTSTLIFWRGVFQFMAISAYYLLLDRGKGFR